MDQPELFERLLTALEALQADVHEIKAAVVIDTDDLVALYQRQTPANESS